MNILCSLDVSLSDLNVLLYMEILVQVYVSPVLL